MSGLEAGGELGAAEDEDVLAGGRFELLYAFGASPSATVVRCQAGAVRLLEKTTFSMPFMRVVMA